MLEFFEWLVSIIIIFGSGFIIIFTLFYIFDYNVVYRQTFWWSTGNGMECSSSKICKFKRLPIFFIKHDVSYRHPIEHPNYKEFLDRYKKRYFGVEE